MGQTRPAQEETRGCLIGFITEYYTSHSYSPTREVAQSCETGAATNIIFGLALGFKSAIIPVFLLALVVFVSFDLLDMFGVALAALGMLSNLATCLAIDVYGPICDNAGGIAEMAELPERVRDVTDALDAAGNTTAAIGKGFAIGSACLVSLALYGAFITRSSIMPKNSITNINIVNGWIFGSLFFGGMLPYAFSALTMKAVGRAANEMVQDIRVQFRNPDVKNGRISPNYNSCIQVATNASLKEMIAPGLLVIITPLVFGIFVHPIIVAGIIPGVIVSGIEMAISMSNTGGAWDNAKKYVEAGHLFDDEGFVRGKGSNEHKAAVVGDTVGDPLKDTSGPSINILCKLQAIISLVFASGFAQTALLGDFFGINDDLK